MPVTPTCKTANCKNKQAASRTLGKGDAISPRICQIKQSGKNKINNFLRPNEKQQVFLIQASSGPPLSDGPLEPGLAEVAAFCPDNWAWFTVGLVILGLFWMATCIPRSLVPNSTSLHQTIFQIFHQLRSSVYFAWLQSWSLNQRETNRRPSQPPSLSASEVGKCSLTHMRSLSIYIYTLI